MCAARMPDPEVVIVGSGISGALIAKVLATAGRRVLIIEAGEQMPPDINGYMTRFLNASAKVPESPYPPDLFDSKGLVDPSTVNAGRPTVLSLGAKGKFGDWQDPKQSYLIQHGPLAFGSTYERINGGTVLNRVPHEAFAELEMRAFDPAVLREAGEAAGNIARAISSPGEAVITVDCLGLSPAWPADDATMRLFAHCHAAASDLGGKVA